VGAGSLGERELLSDDRPLRAILQAGKDPGVNLFFLSFGDAPYRQRRESSPGAT